MGSVSEKTPATHNKKMSSDDMFDHLRDRIVRHELPPGSRLREQELAEEYRQPRTKVREVLAALKQRGLVDHIPNRGAVVVRIDISQVLALYKVREVLEGLAARLATENTTPESWQDLVELFGEPMEAAIKQNDFDSFVSGYETFRRRVILAANNPVLNDMLESIYEKTQVLIRRVIVLPGRGEQGLKEHQAVLAAMRRGDADEAERCRRANMQSAGKFIQQYLDFML
jgi:DNA-binding GntR family transcriptional regulator